MSQETSLFSRAKTLVLLEGIDLPEKWLSVIAAVFCIELVFFKFLPDLGTSLVQNTRSTLTDWQEYQHYYITDHSVHAARFLGNHILLWLATAIQGVVHSSDVRLHPLRIAAGLLTPLYLYAGVILGLQSPARYAWRYFISTFTLAGVIGLYAFYPCDMPSYAALSIALFYVLEERFWPALTFMLITGLFRESSLHAVFFVFVWALCAPSQAMSRKLAWLAAFAVAFTLEYVTVRYFYPGPIASAGKLILDWRFLFLDRGMFSLTTICALGLEIVIVLGCVVKLQAVPPSERDWRHRFFMINCAAFPFWIVFYRMMGGNISEFRMLLPVLLPCIYGIAYCAQRRTRHATSSVMAGRTTMAGAKVTAGLARSAAITAIAGFAIIAGFALMSGAARAANAQAVSAPIRLYVLDCGALIFNRPEDYGLTREEVASTNMVVTCYLIVHPKGTLLFDTGLPDSIVGQPIWANVDDGWGQLKLTTLRGELAKIGMKPSQITYLALSHSDWDHVGNANDYVRSIWLTPTAERDFMFKEGVPPRYLKTYSGLRHARTLQYDGDHDVFGDGRVILKATPGHTPGHQSLYVKLANTGGVVLSGDLYHYAEERTLNRMPKEEESTGTPESRASMEEFLAKTGSQLWIGHSIAFFVSARKAPQWYD